MRRILIPAAVGLVAVAACESPDEARPVGGNAATMEITAAGTAFPDTAGEQQWLRFQRNVEQGSGGRIKVRMLVHGQLGSEEQIVAGLRRNRVQVGNLSAMVASTLVPETAILYAPFLFDSEEQADFVYDHFLTGLFTDLLAEQNLHLLRWNEIGFHHIYSVTPVRSPADMRGLRFRVSASDASRLFARALGADIIPLGYGEIVQSLQTGLIEGGENSVSLYARTGISGEASHLTLTAHSFGMSVIVANKSWWDALSGPDRQLVADAYPSAPESRRVTREEARQDLENAAQLGFAPRWPDAAERAAWVESVRHVPNDLAARVGGRSHLVLEKVTEGRAAFARMHNAG